mmetsp:Transcript_13884/g.21445  ORF Transcript_13884/g.21445 Transcript_13884/m.21445 type:complete len:100 (-) Transcript_13884:105-404(-)|eukprot:CAMPEP_0194203702 /NCGR_PEP_ID=MMETSP0156-20130528/3407_1 /TAXON_ID=33649 /ORGANISM="Thalassionema nitzschioides, Strain L26-B" /LENGTH=99 /DNA_ID=CAMNT_0038929501 /DNA_START=21 /DNA_END=320 /DNA_ORIENTATION=+
MVMPTIARRSIGTNVVQTKRDILCTDESTQDKRCRPQEESSLQCPPSKKVKMFNSQDDDVLDQISREVHSISEWKNLLLTWDSEKENLPFEAMSTTIPV